MDEYLNNHYFPKLDVNCGILLIMEEFDQKWRDMTKLGEFELIMAEFVQKKKELCYKW